MNANDDWQHVTDGTLCVAGRYWCERHECWECAESHDEVEVRLA